MSVVTLRYHLEDNGYIAGFQASSLASELAWNIPAGSGSLAQVSLDPFGALTINASNMQAANALSALLPSNTITTNDTGRISVEGNNVNTISNLVTAISQINFPGATLVRDL